MDTRVEFVGVAANMPGASGFTVAAFKADEVPPGTRLYKQAKLTWSTGEPELFDRLIAQFIVAVHRQGIPGIPAVFSAYYTHDGWRQIVGEEVVPLLNQGDVVRGWMELPAFA